MLNALEMSCRCGMAPEHTVGWCAALHKLKLAEKADHAEILS